MVYNAPSPLQTCIARGIATLEEALDEALDASNVFGGRLKKHTPSVIKQSGSKCFKEAPIASFHPTRCNFIMMAFVYFKCLASLRGDSILHY